LVIALTPQTDTRTLLENELVYWLRNDGYDATASVKLAEPLPALLTSEEIKKMVDDHGLQGILTLRLLDLEKETRYVSATETHAVTITDTYVYNYLNAWNSVYVPGYYANSTLLKIETNLFECDNEQMVFTSESQTLDAQSFEEVISDLSKALAFNIKKSKVLTKSF